MRNACNIVLVGFHDFAGERSERSPRVQPPEFIEALRNVPCLLENFQIAGQIFDDVFLVLLENHNMPMATSKNSFSRNRLN